MAAAQVSKPRGEWELVERDIPEPDRREVRVKVEACGICHSDMLVKEGLWPGLQYPRVPGHETRWWASYSGDGSQRQSDFGPRGRIVSRGQETTGVIQRAMTAGLPHTHLV